ncbi:hypothetical protein QQS21_006208 [Conoideocrella luteorostrata]|uniref:Uncharacterized protein n=1 Tax=Conoideocrella luteorostrata TaxID=1105319 RepID=A0AAJ0CQY5_9HYPO|nr:hypothetical protein QQS21_006208 [Conoideocrella luteorostrata]
MRCCAVLGAIAVGIASGVHMMGGLTSYLWADTRDDIMAAEETPETQTTHMTELPTMSTTPARFPAPAHRPQAGYNSTLRTVFAPAGTGTAAVGHVVIHFTNSSHALTAAPGSVSMVPEIEFARNGTAK